MDNMKDEFYLYIFTLIEMGNITSYIFYNMIKITLETEMTNLLIDIMDYDIISIVSGVVVRKSEYMEERDFWMDKVKILKLKSCKCLENVTMGIPIQCIPPIVNDESITSIIVLYRPKSTKKKSPCMKITHNPLIFGACNHTTSQRREIENEISSMINEVYDKPSLTSVNEEIILFDFTANTNKIKYYMKFIEKWVNGINSAILGESVNLDILNEFGNLYVCSNVSSYDYIHISAIKWYL
jgi:hypothetical protein